MIHLLWGDVSQAIEALRPHAPTLVIADPNWTYTNTGGQSGKFRGTSRKLYGETTMEEIAGILDSAWEVTAEHGYLCLWACSPLLAETLTAMASTRWRYLTCGVWHKQRATIGVGFHVRSEVEPWLLFGKGSPRPSVRKLLSYQPGPVADRTEKPEVVVSNIIRCLTSPGDWVGSLWSGRAPELRAAAALGRNAIGAEIDRWAWVQAGLRLETLGAPPPQVEGWLYAWARLTLARQRTTDLVELMSLAGCDEGGVEALKERGAIVATDDGRFRLVRSPPRWGRE